MSEIIRSKSRVVIGDAVATIGSKLKAQNITSQSLSSLLDEQRARIEGETEVSLPGNKRAAPRVGEIGRVDLVQQNIQQLADTVAQSPELLDPDKLPVVNAEQEIRSQTSRRVSR